MYGIEIKSDADTYVRLKRQVRDYNKYFDMNIVVCGSSHGNHISEHVPDNWGIITVEELDNPDIDSSNLQLNSNCDFYVLREPTLNPKVTMLNKLSILWRPELVEIKDKFNLPKYDYLSKANLIIKMEEKIPEDLLQKEICSSLLERDYTKISETIENYRKENQLKKRKYTKKLGVKRKRRSMK